jgi:hypothetical protein
MIVEMCGSPVLLGSQMAQVVGVGHAELRVGLEPIVLEIEAVFNEQRPRKGVKVHAGGGRVQVDGDFAFAA